ncbi:MAG: hypothetical protein ACM3P1_12980 [Candidatus Saccharibacteria bacterium]
MEYEFNFLKALLLTIFIETTVLFLLFYTVFKNEKYAHWLLLLTGTIPTMATLPYLWFIIPLFIHAKLWYNLVCESLAVIVESVIILGLLKVKYPKALMISFICNMASYLVGLLIKW